jgi:polyhydroxybutyrate depolymerase
MRELAGGALLCALLIAALPTHAQDGLTRQSWRVDGVERTALVSTPRGPAPETGWPLVLVFHGHGGTSAQAARSFRMHAAWPDAIVVYPHGLPTPGRLTDPEGRRPGWQHEPGGQDDRDLRFVDAMLTTLSARIDRSRVYAAGHSNGGTMVYVLWAARADRFAAFAPSSSVFGRAIAGARPKPAFVVAGREDRLVPYAAQMRSLDAMLALNRADRAGAPWQGPATVHKSSIAADVVTYLHSGGHELPKDVGALMARFFAERR